MEVTIKLDRSTPKVQFLLLVNALLAAGSFQGGDEETTTTSAAPAPVVNIAKEKPAKEKPAKEKPAKEKPAPTTGGDADEEITDEDVRAKCSELKAAGKMEKVKALITKFGGKSATGVEDRPAFMAELNKL